MILVLMVTYIFILLLPGAELPLVVECFVLLNDIFPFPSILDAGYPVFNLHWQISCLMLSSHLYLGLPCDLLVRGFHLNIFLTVLVSGILCTWLNQLSLWALIQLTILLCVINLSSGILMHFTVKVKLKESLYRSISGPEVPRSLRPPGFETVGMWRW